MIRGGGAEPRRRGAGAGAAAVGAAAARPRRTARSVVNSDSGAAGDGGGGGPARRRWGGGGRPRAAVGRGGGRGGGRGVGAGAGAAVAARPPSAARGWRWRSIVSRSPARVWRSASLASSASSTLRSASAAPRVRASSRRGVGRVAGFDARPGVRPPALPAERRELRLDGRRVEVFARRDGGQLARDGVHRGRAEPHVEDRRLERRVQVVAPDEAPLLALPVAGGGRGPPLAAGARASLIDRLHCWGYCWGPETSNGRCVVGHYADILFSSRCSGESANPQKVLKSAGRIAKVILPSVRAPQRARCIYPQRAPPQNPFDYSYFDNSGTCKVTEMS